MNCSPSVSSNHRILQARILEWIAIRFSRGSSWPRDRTQVSCTEGRFFSLASGPLPPSSTPTPPRYTGSLYHLAIWLHSLFNPILHIPPHQAFRNSDIKVKNTLTAVRPVVLWICLLLLFLWNRPWDASCTSLRPPSNTFSSCNPGISCSAILSSHDQPAPLSELSFFFFFFFFFELSFLLQINHELPDSSELFHPGGGCCQLPGQHATVGLLPLPLSGLLFHPQRCGSGGRGPLFPQTGGGEAPGCRSTSGKHEASAEVAPSLGMCRSVSREVRKIQEALEASLLMVKKWKQPFWVCMAPPLWLTESHILEDGRPPDQQCLQASWSPGWVGRIFLWKAHPQSWLGASETELPFRSSPDVWASAWSPSLQPLGSILTTLEPSPKPWTKWKQ